MHRKQELWLGVDVVPCQPQLLALLCPEGLVGELMPLLCPNSSEGNGAHTHTHTIVSIRNLEFALFLRLLEKILKVEKHMCLPGREP